MFKFCSCFCFFLSFLLTQESSLAFLKLISYLNKYRTIPRLSLLQLEKKPCAPYFFIYYCPSVAKVKSKMIFSTLNSALLTNIKDLGIEISKRIEIDSPGLLKSITSVELSSTKVSFPDELTEEKLSTEITPPTTQQAKSFSKPARPGAGHPRLIRK